MSDKELILRFQAGDSSALGAVYERYKPILTRYFVSWGYVNNAEDLVHETFIKAMQFPDNYPLNIKVSTWLFGIARQRMITGFRKRNAQKRRGYEVSIDDEIPLHIDSGQRTPEEILESKMEVQGIHKKINRLPSLHKEILSLRCYGYKYDEIAQLLEIPVNTVKTRIHRARQAL